MDPLKRSPLASLRQELFANPIDGLVTLLLITGLAAAARHLLHWVLAQAHWAVIQANSTLFAVGRYPIEQQWRLWLLVTLLAGATGLSWECCADCPAGAADPGRLAPQ
jgi:general L-amino acid transport system permease protein